MRARAWLKANDATTWRVYLSRDRSLLILRVRETQVDVMIDLAASYEAAYLRAVTLLRTKVGA